MFQVVYYSGDFFVLSDYILEFTSFNSYLAFGRLLVDCINLFASNVRKFYSYMRFFLYLDLFVIHGPRELVASISCLKCIDAHYRSSRICMARSLVSFALLFGRLS